MGAPAGIALRGGTDSRSARSALHHHPIEIRFQAIEQQRGRFCATRSNAGADGWHLPSAQISGGRPDAQPVCGSAAGRAPRGRVVPLRCYGRARHRPWLASPRTPNEAPSALADGAEARGSEKSERKLAVSRSPKEAHLRRQAHPRMRKAFKQQPTYSVAAGEAVGTSAKYACLQLVMDKAVCLRVVPTVGISVGTPVGITVGIFWGSMGRSVGITVGTLVGIAVGTGRGCIRRRGSERCGPRSRRAGGRNGGG